MNALPPFPTATARDVLYLAGVIALALSRSSGRVDPPFDLASVDKICGHKETISPSFCPARGEDGILR